VKETLTKILVIDDDADLRRAVVDWLGLEGFDVLSAEDGMIGVKYAYHYVPSLIVCDISMPYLDGYGVLVEIRANPATANTPVIFLAAPTANEQIRQGLSVGPVDYITKPFTQRELLEAVKTRLDKKAAQEQDLQHQVHQLEQALAQEHEQRLLKAKLVAMFAHDFRTPLASILSSNSLLRDFADRMDEKRRLTHMTRIDASVSQLLIMLDEMLILAQIDCGILEFKPELLPVGQFFQHIVEEFQAIYIATHRIQFENHFHDTVMADPRLLRQIAANLLSNAIKYSPLESEVRVTLDQHEHQFVLIVQDQGIGIPVADQMRLFDPFQRGSNVGSAPGTGLGLAIVKQAVDLHQGFIRLESEIGVGTTITVTIPMQQM
jgi:signal transduction histidine kinase